MKITIDLPEDMFAGPIQDLVRHELRAATYNGAAEGDLRKLLRRLVIEAVQSVDFAPLVDEALARLAAPTVEELIKTHIEGEVRRALKRRPKAESNDLL